MWGITWVWYGVMGRGVVFMLGVGVLDVAPVLILGE